MLYRGTGAGIEAGATYGPFQIGISIFSGIIGRPWKPIRSSSSKIRSDLPDIDDTVTLPAAASGGISPLIFFPLSSPA